MKHFTLILAASIGLTFSAFAMDEDFGAPFTDQVPAALDDGTLSIENIPPELIEPAAGDYFDSETHEHGEHSHPHSHENGEQEQKDDQEIDL